MDYPTLLEDLKQAMLARDELKVSVLRMLKAEVMKVQTDGSGTEITEALIQTIIQKMIKQRKDSFEQFKAGNRMELAEKEEKEIALLQAYLPEQMSEEAIRAEVRATKEQLGITDKSGVGKLMGALMGKLKGKADGAVIKKIVEEELN
ncbi:MAG: GatB/YqeY domain-containing protein [Candidatus Gracilibacteria bacterium]